MDHSFTSALVLLLLVLDPLGSLPIFISVLRGIEPARRERPYVITVASRTARKNLAALDRAAARLGLPVLAAGPLEGPNGARVAFWVAPNIEFYELDPAVFNSIGVAQFYRRLQSAP